LIADALALKRSPNSIGAARCKSWGFTDRLTTCSFDVSQRDFTVLLSGRRWTVQPATGGSYGFSGGPKVGPEFPVEVEYIALPPEFKHGGEVRLVANHERTRVQVDLYEE
jgi:hypothetical protein